MLRAVLGSIAVLSLCAASILAADNKNNKDLKNPKADHAAKATIKKVDSRNGTVTVGMKDKDGKETEKTFHLTEDIRYLDSTGKAVAVDVFRSGDYVLVVEEQGKLKEMRKDKDHGAADATSSGNQKNKSSQDNNKDKSKDNNKDKK